MPNIASRAIALFVLLLTVAASGLAATASEFYLNLLKRGIANYDTGHYDVAVRELDVAAFGLIESVDHFETAKIYSALANDKLGRQPQARAAAQRVLAAERVQRRFAQIAIPNEVRTAFLAVAKKVLSAGEAAALTSTSAPVPAPVQTQPRVTQQSGGKTQPQPKQQPPATTTPPKSPTSTPPAATMPPQTSASAMVPVTYAAARLASADRYLAENKLTAARDVYRELVNAALDRPNLLKVAEGAYRARDFATTVRAFDRIGTLAKGEEPYRFYLAVALYETGNFKRAKRELTAALPFIEVTPAIAQYRAKIEGAAD